MAPKISVVDITKHSTPEDCWLVINDQVYDLSSFAPTHPGGADIIYKFAGKDGSKTYNSVHAPNLIEKELSLSNKKGAFDLSTVTQIWIDSNKEEESISTTLGPNERPPLSTLINLDDFEKVHASHGPRKANAYVEGASNDCLTLAANKSLWQKLWFRPRIMRNVSKVNTKMTMLGVKTTMPVFICPMGIAKTSGPQGEAALGAGAAASGIIHCVSTTASLSLEDVLASAPQHPFFFQLYVDKQRHKTEATLKKIEKMEQIRAIFVTVDLAVVSKREADERMRKQEATSVYSSRQKNVIDKKGAGLARTTGNFIDWSLSWEDLAWLRKHTTKPILLKGIQSAADAKMALQMGCAGIVVSNHGGRALDNAPATILILLELRRDCPEIFDKMEVYIDGGVRRGSDILKAVCLGARGVGVGRPFQCSVMYDQEGVESIAWILQDELETSMRLCGITDLDKVRGDISYLNTSEIQQFLPPPLKKTSFFGFSRAKL
ncbi:cytochrome b2 [Acrodontium crateriforme]|uniref:Cytochrome b2 n=1 Tax=Acrodontium crateriforme TaxID=150365 RepID=A0AAQ3M6C6_9PEZI|nr:cytochrome b2 [Acrodontium crateriforme]